jgi:hypothetical protein
LRRPAPYFAVNSRAWGRVCTPPSPSPAQLGGMQPAAALQEAADLRAAGLELLRLLEEDLGEEPAAWVREKVAALPGGDQGQEEEEPAAHEQEDQGEAGQDEQGHDEQESAEAEGATPAPATLRCAECGAEFTSRNALFSHLDAFDHHVDGQQQQQQQAAVAEEECGGNTALRAYYAAQLAPTLAARADPALWERSYATLQRALPLTLRRTTHASHGGLADLALRLLRRGAPEHSLMPVPLGPASAAAGCAECAPPSAVAASPAWMLLPVGWTSTARELLGAAQVRRCSTHPAPPRCAAGRRC